MSGANEWYDPSAEIDDLREKLRQVDRDLQNDWERVNRGGIYDRDKRVALFAEKRRLLDALTVSTNTGLPPTPAAILGKEFLAPAETSLLVRALNVSSRMVRIEQDSQAQKLEEEQRTRIHDFTGLLSSSFALSYTDLRGNSHPLTDDDPLMVTDGTVFLSYFLNTDEGVWQIQPGVLSGKVVNWFPYGVTSLAELGNAIEQVLRGNSSREPYAHNRRSFR